MRFELDDVTTAVRAEMTDKAQARLQRIGTIGAHDDATWREICEFGLLTGEEDGLRAVDVAAGMTALASGGLPGPVLEAALAVASGSARATQLVRAGELVTSIGPGRPGREIAGWGAVSRAIVDQRTGATLSDGPGDAVTTALPMEHGWVVRPEAEGDPLATLRHLYTGALVAGLCKGELAIANDHVKKRTQFGRTLSSFQAVQFRLAEAAVKAEAGELMVLDAARRLDAGDPFGPTAAALAWIYLSDVSEFVEKQAIQVMGAIGFTTEMGLVRLTYQSAWLRGSVAAASAVASVRESRSATAVPPVSVIPAGFSV
jgi:hypothetical protein